MNPSDERLLAAECARDHRRLMAWRLPWFAVVWLGLELSWRAVQAAAGQRTDASLVLLHVAQILVFAVAILLCRRDPGAPRVRGIVVATCVLTAVIATRIAAVSGEAREVLVFGLSTIGLASALMFAWDWRASLVLLGGMLGTLAVAAPRLPAVLPPGTAPMETIVAFGVWMAIAEMSARGFRRNWIHAAHERRAMHALAASRDAYRDLAENASDLIYTHDLAGRFTYVNAAFAHYAGAPAEALVGRTCFEIVDAEPPNPDLAAVIARVQMGEEVPPQLLTVQRDGQRRWLECAVTGMRDASGRVVGVRGIARDVTARTEAERQLRESEARYRGLVDSQQELVVRFDAQGRFSFVNDASCVIAGRERAALLGTSFIDLVHPEDVSAVWEAQAQIRADARVSLDTRMRTALGMRWIAWEGCVIRDAAGNLAEVQAVGRDVTDRRATEYALRASLEELRRGEEKLRRLAQHLALVREEERKRLGFDLHDDVCQELVGIGILVASLRRQLGPVGPEGEQAFARIERYLTEVGDHLRGLARDLRPLLLRDLGLEESLRSLAEGMATATTAVVVRVRGSVPRLEEETEIGVYRIAQEALTNALRHADAAHVIVTLAVEGDDLVLEVRDDGRGFSLDAERRVGALGLLGMEERALALSGRLEVSSEPGRGASVRLRCPRVLRVPATAA